MRKYFQKPALTGAICVAAVLLLGGCALPQPVYPGDSEAQVLAARGKPTNRYRVGNEELLEYMTGPYGEETWMARMGADGKLISFEQVLTNEKFASLRINEASREDVLHTIGAPSERSYLPLSKLEVWTYSYLESGVWHSLMHVHFDNGGIVRKMINTPNLQFLDQGNVLGGGPGPAAYADAPARLRATVAD